ncbi:MAG: RIP metalloprotease RseP [Aquabacterium sp.]
MITALALIATLAILIVVHEWGHYRVAVACGVKVLRFSVGFGRVLWRWQKDPQSTEFVVCALPLGGYVRMLDEREGPVAPQDLARSFGRQPLSRRVAIVAAGPLANLLLAVGLYAGQHWIGIEEPKALMSTPVAGSIAERAGIGAGDWVQAVRTEGGEWQQLRSMTDLRWQVLQAVIEKRPLTVQISDNEGRGRRERTLQLDAVASSEIDASLLRRVGLGEPMREPVLGTIAAGTPAADAGLQRGDRVTMIDGRPLLDAQGLRERIRASLQDGRPKTMEWRVERGSQVLTLTVTPRVFRDGERDIGRIDAPVGVNPPALVTVRYGLWDGLSRGAERTWEVSALTLRMLGRMLIGEVSVRNLSGPIAIAEGAGQHAQQGLPYFLGFLAFISVSLGVLNLLPLPVLDGGHLMYYLFEAVTGRPVSDLWLARLQRGGVAVLLLLMSVALFNDVARLLGHP